MRTLLLAGAAAVALIGQAKAEANYLYDDTGTAVVELPTFAHASYLYDRNNQYIGQQITIGGTAYIRFLDAPTNQYVDFDQDPSVPPVNGFFSQKAMDTYYTTQNCTGQPYMLAYKFPVDGQLTWPRSGVPSGSATVYFAGPPFISVNTQSRKGGPLQTCSTNVLASNVVGVQKTHTFTAPLPWHLSPIPGMDKVGLPATPFN